MPQAHIGTSGWSYSHWRNGVFYPPKLPSKDWLDFYAQRFNAVEINASFYRVPKRETVETWSQIPPGGFEFVVKVWRALTHYNRLVDFEDNAERFLEAIEPFGHCLGPMLVQLHPSMRRDEETLDHFLEVFGRQIRTHFPAVRSPRIAVEFRQKSWYVPEVMKVLSQHDAAAVIHDMPGSKLDEPNECSFIYVRRHGSTGRYAGSYSDDQLGKFADRLRGWMEAGKDVYIFFNNDQKGYAPANAARLAAEVLGGMDEAIASETAK